MKKLWRRVLGWAGFTLYATTAIVVPIELGLRLFMPQPLPQVTPDIYRPDLRLGWRRNPDVRTLAKSGERAVEFCTDAAGDRIDCGNPRRQGCTRRVMVMGDSYVAALAIPWPESFYSRIERDTGACVHVAGVVGYGPAQYLAQVRERLGAGAERYDLVILSLYAGNDFTNDADAVPGWQRMALPELHVLPAGLSREALWDWAYPINQWLEAHSHAYVAARLAVRRALDPDGVSRYGIPKPLQRSRLTERMLEGTTRAVRQLAAEVKHSGASLLVVLIPVRNQVLDPQAEQLLRRFGHLRGDLDMDLVSRELLPRLREIDEIDTVIDTLPYFRAHADRACWGQRDPHFSPGGHALWFDAIRSEVRALLGLT